QRPAPPSRSGSFADLAADLCACYILDIVIGGNLDGCSQGDRSRQSLMALAGPEALSDEAVLGQWGSIFNRNAAGQRYINFYAENYGKIARLAAQDLGLLNDAIDTLQNFMPGIRAMVGGYGDEVVLTQKMINDGLDIWQRLSDRDTGNLSAFIELELQTWNNMQDFVGLTFDEWGTMIGLQVGAVADDRIFNDAFEQ
ncbi:MAG: hypothetical protein AAGJ52_14450, partial [Pseudomonadota bacterium]